VKNFTRTIIATACLMTSFGALAHNYKGDYKAEVMPLMPVTIPVLPGGFDFTLGGLWLKPTSSNVEYFSSTKTVDSTVDGVGITSQTDTSEEVSPNYTWGFLLGLGYIFPGTAWDARVDWQHLHDNGDTDSTTLKAITDVAIEALPLGNRIGVDTPPEKFFAEGEVVYDFDAVDLTFGQFINIGPRLQTRLFTGLRWARLDNDLSGSYRFTGITGTGEGTVDPRNFTADSDSTFNGIGPIFGIAANYAVGYNIGIAGYFDAALLVGKLSLEQSTNELEFDSATGVLTDKSPVNFNFDDLSVVAPAWDARLGINYTYLISNGAAFRFEIGYQVSKYIDVINNSQFVTSNGLVSDPTVTTNFGLNGLYFQGTLVV